MPTWVGDIVMATPVLRALRQAMPDTHITAVIKSPVRLMLDRCPWIDARLTLGLNDANTTADIQRIRRRHFDSALLLTNSFRSAWVAWRAGIARRIGYARDGRSMLLTDKLYPPKQGRRYLPTPAIGYYLKLLEPLGIHNDDRRMMLFTRSDDDAWACDTLARITDQYGDGPKIIFTAGGRYGAAKLWPAERYAQLADRLIENDRAVILLSGAPNERPILQRIVDQAKHPLVNLPETGMKFRQLKSVVQRCDMMIGNDTGPRHIAAAFGLPMVTIFGPTDPKWTTIDHPLERELSANVECSPCQLKTCPIDHRCMTRLTVDAVYAHAAAVLEAHVMPGRGA